MKSVETLRCPENMFSYIKIRLINKYADFYEHQTVLKYEAAEKVQLICVSLFLKFKEKQNMYEIFCTQVHC